MDNALIDNIHRLAHGWRETQTLPSGKRTIQHPPLLTELAQAAHWSRASDDENDGGGARGVFRSRPPMVEAPWLLLDELESAIMRRARKMGLRPRRSPHAQLGAILAASAGLESSMQESLALEVQGWRIRAETALKYREAPRTLEAPCPLCQVKHVLRVYIGEYGPERAACHACGEAWEHDALGVLAEMLDVAGHP